ncbi:MAG TPA: 4'-phosphopantetheinyl transferase superfamily protein [Trichormus sp.]|jgi:4'-phosphopantetheinyl transferase
MNDRLCIREDIHLWLFDRAAMAPAVPAFRELLGADEIVRAERFYTTELQERFILTRGFLRRLLGDYLDIDPKNVRFKYGDNGKPSIEHEDAQYPLRFNLAHSGPKALCGVTLNRDIGIDLEETRVVRNLEQICDRFFSAEEASTIQRLPTAQRENAFFRCWTAKEAFIKATGEGLSRALNSFKVSLSESEDGQIQIRTDDGWVPFSGRLWHLQPAPGFFAAVVAEQAEQARLLLRTWNAEHA